MCTGLTGPMIQAKIYLPRPLPAVLAMGSHSKNSVAILRDREICLSHETGNLSKLGSVLLFEKTVRTFLKEFAVEPIAVACDMHPDYVSTQNASKIGLPLVRTQHHHAHIVSTMADNELDGPVLGVAWDGTGLGPDETIWGSEFLIADWQRFHRFAHLRPFPLPGGDAAGSQIWRSALGMLYQVYGEEVWQLGLPFLTGLDSARPALSKMLERRINCPYTSSIGRFFDAIAAITGLKRQCRFEAEAAILLEKVAELDDSRPYEFQLNHGLLDWEFMVRGIVEDVHGGVAVPKIAGKFHQTLIAMISAVATEAGMGKVVLTGGCFQNAILQKEAVHQLKELGFEVYCKRRVPLGDDGLSVGQAVIAGTYLQDMLNGKEARHVSWNPGQGS